MKAQAQGRRRRKKRGNNWSKRRRLTVVDDKQVEGEDEDEDEDEDQRAPSIYRSGTLREYMESVESRELEDGPVNLLDLPTTASEPPPILR